MKRIGLLSFLLSLFVFISCGEERKYELGTVLTKTFEVNGESMSRNVEVTELSVFDNETGVRTYTNLKESEKNYTEHFEENYYWKEVDSKVVKSIKWEEDESELRRTEKEFSDFFGEETWITVYDAETKIRKMSLRTKVWKNESNIESSGETTEFFDLDGKNVEYYEYASYFDGELTGKVVTEYEYDEKGQCIHSIQKDFWRNENTPNRVFDVKYEYNEKGYLVRAVSANGVVVWFHDGENPFSGRKLATNEQIELEYYVLSNFYDKIWHETKEDCSGTYDEKGNLIFAKYEDSEQFFEYNESGKCTHWKEVWNSGKIDERWTEYFDDGEIKREVRTDGDFWEREYNSVNGRHDLVYEKTSENEVFYEYIYDKNGIVSRMTGFTTLNNEEETK